MQALNAKKVANDWSDKKAIDVFKSLLVEEKCTWKWWNTEMPLTHPGLDRTDWTEVRKVFRKRWPPLPDIEDDVDLKCEELETMRLETQDLGAKVKYRGQDLYTHVAFAMEATRLASDIGDTSGFLLPALQNKLPEALRNVLKSQGKKLKTWDDFRKAMIAVSLLDLREEATEIAQREDIYAEVRAMRTTATGLTPVMTRTGL